MEPTYNEAFLDGQKYGLEKMLKESVDGMIRKDGTIGYFEMTDEQQFKSLLEKFQDGDKVRIIIVKEDQK